MKVCCGAGAGRVMRILQEFLIDILGEVLQGVIPRKTGPVALVDYVLDVGFVGKHGACIRVM